MKNDRPKAIRYTVEREFSGKITVTEFINRIIQSHVKEQTRIER